jgi:hypothetical protein
MEGEMLNRILLYAMLIPALLTAGLIHAFQAKLADQPLVEPAAKSQIGSLPAGFVAISDPTSLPLPTSGYRFYLVGEAHGNRENETVFLSYLSRLYRDADLRDIVIEEDQVYDDEAIAFVQGKRTGLPGGLCLRANILEGVRKFNQGLPVNRQVRVHLVDIDSPAHAIRRHLSSLMERIGKTAKELQIPEEQDFSSSRVGVLIDRLKGFTSNRKILSELRTVSLSLDAYDNGFRVHTGDVQGNPLDPAREEAITGNILDLLKSIAIKTPVLGLYGDMHVRGGPAMWLNPVTGKSYEHMPLAYRLEKAGIKVYKFACHPLSGSFQWRWGLMEMLSDEAVQFKLASGDTLSDVFERAQGSPFLFVDFSSGIRLMKEAEEFSGFFDSCLFVRRANPIDSRCQPIQIKAGG